LSEKKNCLKDQKSQRHENNGKTRKDKSRFPRVFDKFFALETMGEVHFDIFANC